MTGQLFMNEDLLHLAGPTFSESDAPEPATSDAEASQSADRRVAVRRSDPPAASRLSVAVSCLVLVAIDASTWVKGGGASTRRRASRQKRRHNVQASGSRRLPDGGGLLDLFPFRRCVLNVRFNHPQGFVCSP